MSHSRSTKGCLTCRSRKVKCNEEHPQCSACARLHLECRWNTVTGDTFEVPARRNSKPCPKCRTKKTRCRCSGSLVDHSSTNLSSEATLHLLLDRYFRGPHYFCFFTFIHQPSFLRMLQDGVAPRPLVLITAATALRISCYYDENAVSTADAWAEDCERSLMSDVMQHVSVVNLMALILLQRYHWLQSSHTKAWLISGMAHRVAHALKINRDPRGSHSDLTSQNHPVYRSLLESRRRLAWSCLVMESSLDAGSDPLQKLDELSIQVPLPCSEEVFINRSAAPEPVPSMFTNRTENFGATKGKDNAGTSTFLLQITALRMLILSYVIPFHPTRSTPPFSAHTTLPWEAGSRFEKLKEHIEAWAASIPSSYEFDSVKISQQSPCTVSFVTMWVFYHVCWCDIHRIGSFINARFARFCDKNPNSRPSDMINAENNGYPDPRTAKESDLAEMDEAFHRFIDVCREIKLKHCMHLASVVDTAMRHLTIEWWDPFVSICCCLVVRVFHWDHDLDVITEILDTTPEHIIETTHVLLRCIERNARWSAIIRVLHTECERLVQKSVAKLNSKNNLPPAHVNSLDNGNESLSMTYSPFRDITEQAYIHGVNSEMKVQAQKRRRLGNEMSRNTVTRLNNESDENDMNEEEDDTASRAGSPGLRRYGAVGTIRRELSRGDGMREFHSLLFAAEQEQLRGSDTSDAVEKTGTSSSKPGQIVSSANSTDTLEASPSANTADISTVANDSSFLDTRNVVNDSIVAREECNVSINPTLQSIEVGNDAVNVSTEIALSPYAVSNVALDGRVADSETVPTDVTSRPIPRVVNLPESQETGTSVPESSSNGGFNTFSNDFTSNLEDNQRSPSYLLNSSYSLSGFSLESPDLPDNIMATGNTNFREMNWDVDWLLRF